MKTFESCTDFAEFARLVVGSVDALLATKKPMSPWPDVFDVRSSDKVFVVFYPVGDANRLAAFGSIAQYREEHGIPESAPTAEFGPITLVSPPMGILIGQPRAAKTTKIIDVAVALRHVNGHRARIGQRRLDPAASQWTGDDVIAEALRLGWRP
jgi:hypothetical protein